MEISRYPLPFSEFSQQISEVWDQSLAKKQITTSQAARRDEFEDKCYRLYLNAFHGKLPFMVIGQEDLRESVEHLYNFGVLTADDVCCQKTINGPLSPELKQGAILSQKKWSILLNDSYVLGAVHANKDFHLYEPDGSLSNKDLWDPTYHRPRVLGRELMMLKAAGFSRFEHPFTQMETVFVRKEDQSMSLKKLINVAEKTESLNEIRDFIRTNLLKRNDRVE